MKKLLKNVAEHWPLYLGIACVVLLFLVNVKQPAADEAATRMYLQAQKALKADEELIHQQLDDQQKQIDSLKHKDSIASARYQALATGNKKILDSLTLKKNEKINRIQHYGSDSLRRAYAEPVSF